MQARLFPRCIRRTYSLEWTIQARKNSCKKNIHPCVFLCVFAHVLQGHVRSRKKAWFHSEASPFHSGSVQVHISHSKNETKDGEHNWAAGTNNQDLRLNADQPSCILRTQIVVLLEILPRVVVVAVVVEEWQGWALAAAPTNGLAILQLRSSISQHTRTRTHDPCAISSSPFSTIPESEGRRSDGVWRGWEGLFEVVWDGWNIRRPRG